MNRDIVEAFFDLVRGIIEELGIQEDISKLLTWIKLDFQWKIALEISLLKGGKVQRIYDGN